MDKLKRFIDNNKEAFLNDEMPPIGHLERFEKKLTSPKGKRLYLYIVTAITIAASFAILLISNKNEIVTLERDNIDMTARAININKEKEELIIYYNMRICDIQEEMKKLYEINKSDGAKELLLEGKRILTDNSEFENMLLPNMPSSEEAIFAITQHYNNSIDGLSIMLEQMRNLTNKRNINNI